MTAETYRGTVFYRSHGDGSECVSKTHHNGKVQEVCCHFRALEADWKARETALMLQIEVMKEPT